MTKSLSMKNVDLYSLYVSRPVRLLVYLFGLFIIVYTFRLIHGINDYTHQIEQQAQSSKSQYDTFTKESLQA